MHIGEGSVAESAGVSDMLQVTGGLGGFFCNVSLYATFYTLGNI